GHWELLQGVNPIWQEIRRTIEKAIPYHPNVLIEGETGTGKEVIARTIHNLSGRKGEFVPINCGAIPAELLESELFGYEEGAFTGAKKGGNLGKFAWADEGTIFLDEIGEMPLSMQVSLLRFLQDKTIIPVGSNTPRKLDVQIIAATNRNLEEEIAKGNFRSDLYYRLNVVNIYLPPLRERKDDLPWLINLLLKELKEQYDHKVQITEEADELLKKYHWPGNVRELRNVLERGFIHSDGGWIASRDLPQFITANISQSAEKPSNLRESPENKEKKMILEALEVCQGNISATARKLGISRVTLYKKIHNFGIQR
ncbi:MAG: sigma-54-dependent Fis family transcriptional regulator, partial [Desulfitobacterium sp.]|nr:sigma-54-dependent Fis family transcriptional regulator [Desulfitobacterium sp.]